MTNRIPVIEKILSANDRIAAENHQILEDQDVFSINLMASPGAGKSSLIEQTLGRLASEIKIAVIDGDIATSLGADRAAAGSLEVVSTTRPQPTIAPDTVSGTNLVVSVPTVLGFNYVLQSTTNLAPRIVWEQRVHQGRHGR